ncbi:hypothetical protein MTO96_027090 [Rhipicephalus appendiculatus]
MKKGVIGVYRTSQCGSTQHLYHAAERALGAGVQSYDRRSEPNRTARNCVTSHALRGKPRGTEKNENTANIEGERERDKLDRKVSHVVSPNDKRNTMSVGGGCRASQLEHGPS